MKARPPKECSAVRPDVAQKTRLCRAERRLRELERLYDVVMEGINEGIDDWNVAQDSIRYPERVHKAVSRSIH